ncbi:hypothetical protein LZ32DRAFT_333721 [Colletotrichum eremochloae]|nr:hypothetical protein LZ32DRAFT_333721 [Colletotrichum eremochloae]
MHPSCGRHLHSSTAPQPGPSPLAAASCALGSRTAWVRPAYPCITRSGWQPSVLARHPNTCPIHGQRSYLLSRLQPRSCQPSFPSSAYAPLSSCLDISTIRVH